MKLSRYVTVRREIPHSPGDWMEFRLPSSEMCATAREERRIFGIKQTVATRKAFGSDVLEEFRQEREKARDAALARGEDPDAAGSTALTKPRDPVAEANAALEEYDRVTLLRHGIAAWSIEDDAGNVAPITEENVKDLDEATSRWAGLTLIALMQSGFDAPEVVLTDDGYVIETVSSHPFAGTSPSMNGSFVETTAVPLGS